MTSTTTNIETPTPAAPHRRLDDQFLPGRPLDWGDDGTPLPVSSVVYLYRPRASRLNQWAEITTQEHLAGVQADPEHFELRTLFGVPVDEVSRAPIVVVMNAQVVLDRAERHRVAAVVKLQAALAALGEAP